MSQEINNPHDLFLKATLASPQAIQEFFEAHLPPSLLKRIDTSSISLTHKSYVSSVLKEFHNDLVFSCQIDKKPGYLYLILEHQSSPDWLLPLRFIEYNLALLKDYWKGKKAGTKLPLIINLCLYHGKNLKPYPYSNKLYNYFKDPQLAEDIGMFNQFMLLDLGIKPDEELAQHGSIGLMETLLKYSRERDVFHILGEMLEKSRSWLLGIEMDAAPLGEDYWKTVLVYVSSLLDPAYYSEEDLVDLFVEKLTKEKEEVMRTIAQQIEKRGEKRGMQEGMHNEKLAIAKNMLKEGFGIDIVEKVTNLSKEAIKELKK